MKSSQRLDPHGWAIGCRARHPARQFTANARPARPWRAAFNMPQRLSEVHSANGTADREDRDGCVVADFARRTLGGARHRNEGANLESALPAVTPGRRIRITGQRRPVVGGPAVQELPVPGFVDLAGIRGRRPVGNAARSHQGDAFINSVASRPQRPAELIGPVRRRQRRPLAIDVRGNHRHVVCRRQKVQRHHDAVVEFPLLGIGQVDANP